MYDTIKKRLKDTARKHGLDFLGFGFHSFRRAAITRIQEMGASSIEAQRFAGHASAAMTKEYTYLQQQRQRDLIEAHQARFMGDKVVSIRKKKGA